MASNHNLGGNYWGYLFEPDKSPTPLLKQLCLGIAKIIGKLEPCPDTELTPKRLAAFYRSVGGNYDSVFLNNSGLSLMYRTLGCFHTLQPTSNPFEAPSIPALLPIGFVEWQRLQLLLCPGEHVPFMQEAVRRYDVPTPDGGIFPKYIPREAFPDRPDESMERWHRLVTGSLEQSTRRLQNSPYASSKDTPHRGEGSSFSNGKLPQVRRPSRSPRSNSRDLDPARYADDRHRSSVPDIPSPSHLVSESSYRGSDAQQSSPPTSRSKPAQYASAHRTSNTSSRHRTSDASLTRHRNSNSSQRTSNSSANFRPTLSSSAASSRQVPPLAHHTRQHHQPGSPSTIDETSSGSEASSEDSQAVMGRNSHEAHDGRRRSSLFPPSVTKHHQRRHSHDATYLSNDKPPLPPRPIGYSPQVQDPLLSAKPVSGYENGPTSGGVPFWNGTGVQFRNIPFDVSGDDCINPALKSPVLIESLSPSKNPKLQSFDPPGRELVRQYDPAEVDQATANQRRSGGFFRASTVRGVGGRKYPATEPRIPSNGSRVSPPTPVGMI